MFVDALTTFAKQARKVLSNEELLWLEEQKKTLAIRPYAGEYLGPAWFRELRHRSKRIYYIIGKSKVLLIDVSNKNTQDATIQQIRLRLYLFKKVAD
jgi:hypothetical protein